MLLVFLNSLVIESKLLEAMMRTVFAPLNQITGPTGYLGGRLQDQTDGGAQAAPTANVRAGSSTEPYGAEGPVTAPAGQSAAAAARAGQSAAAAPTLSDYQFGEIHHGEYLIHRWAPCHCEITSVVVYLPSCNLEAPPGALIRQAPFQWDLPSGGSLVVSPRDNNTTGKPYRRELPVWVEGWLRSFQERMPGVPFHVIGCSRGAAWALKLLETTVPFEKAALIAPYYHARWVHNWEVAPLETRLTQRFQRHDPSSSHGTKIKIVHGTADVWPAPTSLLRLVRASAGANCVETLEGLTHEETLSNLVRIWHGLDIM